MRFREFLRVSVLLYAGAGTVLAAISIAGMTREDNDALTLVALAWWVLAAGTGLWMGRLATTTPGIARLLADARRASALPEWEPGTILFNRLWPLAVLAVVAGALGFFFPQVPAIGTGYALLVALLWRRQPSAIAAIEGRDGVEFWLDRSSPFGPPKLLRLPGLRRIEPEAADARP